MNLVYRPCPSDLLIRLFGEQLSFFTGPIVAGGAARLLWFNELAPLVKYTQSRSVAKSDIDVFVYNGFRQFETTRDYIEQQYNRRKPQPRVTTTAFDLACAIPTPRFETHNAISYNNCELDGRYYNIQLIKHSRQGLLGIFDSFDLVNCHFATDGRTVVATAEAVAAWQANKLVRNPDCQQDVKLDRMLKYLTLGLMPDRTLWNSIMKKTVEARTAGGFPDADYEF
jgi:hypothetical protein